MYFPEDFNKKEKMDYLIKALKFYKEHNKIWGVRKDNNIKNVNIIIPY